MNKTWALTMLVMGSALGSSQAFVLDGIAGYWPFDETDGNVAHEASGAGLNGTLVNYPADQGDWGPGKFGRGLHFGGNTTRQYVRVPDFVKPSSALTISAWVWSDEISASSTTIAANWLGGYGTIWCGFQGFSQLAYVACPASQPGAHVLNGSACCLSSLTNGWHHVAVVTDLAANRMELWYDGQAVTKTLDNEKGVFVAAPSPYLDIGGSPDWGYSNNGYWTGRLDDLAVWPRALGTAEVLAIYRAGLSGVPLSTFAPPTLAYQVLAGGIILRWSDPTYILLTAPQPTGPWTIVYDTQREFVTSPYADTATGVNRYFRLVRRLDR